MELPIVHWAVVSEAAYPAGFPVVYTGERAERFLRVLSLIKGGAVRTGDVIAGARIDSIDLAR